MAMKPEDIIASVNRQVELLTKEKEALQQCFNEGKTSTATVEQQNTTLKQEVTEERWDVYDFRR